MFYQVEPQKYLCYVKLPSGKQSCVFCGFQLLDKPAVAANVFFGST
jgi:hypothetical protein